MEFQKIQEFIQKNKITPRDCEYHTWREAKNKEGKYTGKIRILVWKQDKIARCEYICPECGKYGYIEKPWKRPFSVKCEHCGFLIRVPRLRDEIKKDKKTKS